MSFGKDPSKLQKTGSFRQRATTFNNNKQASRKGGGSNTPYFVNQYKPSLDELDTVRLIEGSYDIPQPNEKGDLVEINLPFFPYAEHFDGREMKGSICSAGPFAKSKGKSDPCRGCDLYWAGMEPGPDGKRRAGRYSRREMQVFTVLDYGEYHKTPQVDRKSGQVKVNEQTGEAYYNWTKCTGRGCDGCQAGNEKKSGERRNWPMGWGHYQTLLSCDKDIGKSCSNCGGVDSVEAVHWACRACGEGVVDMANTTMKQKDIDNITDKPFHCTCGSVEMLEEVIECKQCTPAGGTAKRATIFDVDISVKRIASSDGGNQTTLNITKWSAPRPIDPRFKELAQPLDLPKIFAPTSMELQTQLFGAAERQPVTATDMSRQYNTGKPGGTYR